MMAWVAKYASKTLTVTPTAPGNRSRSQPQAMQMQLQSVTGLSCRTGETRAATSMKTVSNIADAFSTVASWATRLGNKDHAVAAARTTMPAERTIQQLRHSFDEQV